MALGYYYYAIHSYFLKEKRIDEMITDFIMAAEAQFSTGMILRETYNIVFPTFSWDIRSEKQLHKISVTSTAIEVP